MALQILNTLSNEIINNEAVFNETGIVVNNLVTGQFDIAQLVENLGTVLTNKDVEHREKGMRYFTKILKEIPSTYLPEKQVNFIAKFYIDRLKDNHRIIPQVLEGYLAIVEMSKYDVTNSALFFTSLFAEVPCQSQVRQDRYNIYLILKKHLDNHMEYIKSLGPDFVYGVISAIEGERDPRNLIFLFETLPKFIANVPLGHLTEEMFDVVSCYFPIDFHPPPDDPGAVTRQDLSDALAPCLCATPEFAEHCLLLLVEKLDSSLRVAKLDSFKLLTISIKTFKAESYIPFIKTLWSSIHKVVTQKTDDETNVAAHEALAALVKILSTIQNTDKEFENFVKTIVIAMQQIISNATIATQLVLAKRVLLTTGYASKESAIYVIKLMIPAVTAFYRFKDVQRLQLAILDFLGDLNDLAKHWNLTSEIQTELNEIPQICLLAVNHPAKEFQATGLRNLVRAQNTLTRELVVPYTEVLIHKIQHSPDKDLLSLCVEAIHVIGRKYPEDIMALVVKEKCNFEALTTEKDLLQKRLNLLCNLASIDEFTKIIIEEMLSVISRDSENAADVVKALKDSMSNVSFYSETKMSQIESDHGLVDSIILWLINQSKQTCSREHLVDGLKLIENTVSNLTENKQKSTLEKHTPQLLNKSKNDELSFLILESLYTSLRQNVFIPCMLDIMEISLNTSLSSSDQFIRDRACVLISHFLNKAEYGNQFDVLYEKLKSFLGNMTTHDSSLCPKLIHLYGWVTKALIMRGSDSYSFWMKKIVTSIPNSDLCMNAAESIKLIMSNPPDYLSQKQHCRVSLLYKQRVFETFCNLTENISGLDGKTNEAYLLCWSHILAKVSKTALNNNVDKVCPLVIESLHYDNKELLLVSLDVINSIAKTKNANVASSLQTLLPRLIKLAGYVKSMDVRLKSLQCLYDIANVYPTALLLPFKQDVLLDLATSLDDKKRLVRNVAVRARTRWFLVGAPGENKEN